MCLSLVLRRTKIQCLIFFFLFHVQLSSHSTGILSCIYSFICCREKAITLSLCKVFILKEEKNRTPKWKKCNQGHLCIFQYSLNSSFLLLVVITNEKKVFSDCDRGKRRKTSSYNHTRLSWMDRFCHDERERENERKGFETLVIVSERIIDDVMRQEKKKK